MTLAEIHAKLLPKVFSAEVFVKTTCQLASQDVPLVVKTVLQSYHIYKAKTDFQ